MVRNFKNGKQLRGSGWTIDLTVLLSIQLIVLIFVVLEIQSVIRTGLGIIAMIVLPGYAFIALLYPHNEPSFPTNTLFDWPSRREMEHLERFILSIGLSVLIVPFVGFVVAHAGYQLSPSMLVYSIAVVTVIFSIGAFIRRFNLQATERYTIIEVFPSIEHYSLKNQFSTSRNFIIMIVLLVGCGIAIAGVTTAFITAESGEEYTEMYLLMEDPDSEEYIAYNYSVDDTLIEQSNIYLSLRNLEGKAVAYEIVVQAEYVDSEENSIIHRHEVDQLTQRIAHGQRERFEYSINQDEIEGANRISFLVYTSTPPSEPTPANAYRSVHIWIDQD